MNLGYKRIFPWSAPTFFKEKILNQTAGVYGYPKIHTFRADVNDRWHPGNTIHHAYGIRSKQYDCFLTNECISTQKIEFIYRQNRVYIEIDDRPYCKLPVGWNGSCKYEDIHRMAELAHNDGFDTIDEFLSWFNKDWKGKIIHWTDKRYD